MEKNQPLCEKCGGKVCLTCFDMPKKNSFKKYLKEQLKKPSLKKKYEKELKKLTKPYPRTKKTKYWAVVHEDLTGWLHKPLSFRSVCGVYVCPLYMNKADAEKDACGGDKVVEVRPVIVAPKSRKRGV